MYQGQLCKIQVHENQSPAFSEMLSKDGGWFLKLKDSNGKTKFHLVDQNRAKEVTIDPSLVDESQKNTDPTKPFYVACVVPTNIQPLAMSVSPKMDEMAAKFALESKINALEADRKAALRDLESAQKKVKYHEERIDEYLKKADELYKILSLPAPYFVYAYGKHSADGQEFSWRVPFELYDSVRAGSVVMAETKFGPSPVIVTKVEKSAYLIEHKLIISVG